VKEKISGEKDETLAKKYREYDERIREIWGLVASLMALMHYDGVINPKVGGSYVDKSNEGEGIITGIADATKKTIGGQ